MKRQRRNWNRRNNRRGWERKVKEGMWRGVTNTETSMILKGTQHSAGER